MGVDDDLAQRLLAGHKQFSVVEFELLTVAALPRKELRRPLLSALTQSIIDHAPESDAAQQALKLLFGSACSNSGADVLVLPASTQAPRSPGITTPVGVLVLGFAGANMGILTPTARLYQKSYPEWRVVVTTRTGVNLPSAAAVKAHQLADVLSGLEGCEKVVIHYLSNNGQVPARPLDVRGMCVCMYACKSPACTSPITIGTRAIHARGGSLSGRATSPRTEGYVGTLVLKSRRPIRMAAGFNNGGTSHISHLTNASSHT